MKIRKDVERGLALYQEREALHKLAGKVLRAPDIGACDPKDRWTGVRQERGAVFEFTHLTDELRELVKREVEAQIIVVDQELRGLGFEPDQLVELQPGLEEPEARLPNPIRGMPRPPV